MNKIDIKGMVENDHAFKLNKNKMIDRVTEIVNNIPDRDVLPFMLFLDAKDVPSNKYVKFKINDLEKAPIDCIPIDFSVLYSKNNFESMIHREIELKKEEYGVAYVPYIIQIPTDSNRYKLFESHKVEDRICKLMELTTYEYCIDNGIDDNSIVDNLHLTEIDALCYPPSIEHMEEQVKELIKFSKSEHGVLNERIHNSILPATPKGILLLLLHILESNTLRIRRYSNNFNGLKIAIVGCNSKTTGSHLSKILPKMKSTVTMYHSGSIIVADEFKEYDVIISCAGKSCLINSEHLGVSEFDRILIDVGVSVVDGKISGDLSLCVREIDNIYYTPYINGVGLLTRTALMSNLVQAYSEIYR